MKYLPARGAKEKEQAKANRPRYGMARHMLLLSLRLTITRYGMARSSGKLEFKAQPSNSFSPGK